MKLNRKTRNKILARWIGSRIIRNRVILRCGCEFSARQMIEATAKTNGAKLS